MLNWVLSILVHKKILSEAEAEHLSKELTTKIHSQSFADTHAVVDKVLKEFERNK